MLLLSRGASGWLVARYRPTVLLMTEPRDVTDVIGPLVPSSVVGDIFAQMDGRDDSGGAPGTGAPLPPRGGPPQLSGEATTDEA
jgi:hypothetical protein